MTKILAINGSYRKDGITDRTIQIMANSAADAGAEVEHILLRDYPIEFCLNCRECTQSPGETPGTCVQNDGMQELVSKIEQADAYIFASPTNFGSVTALYKRFMERLTVYGYWPWGKPYPIYRKKNIQPKKKAIIISSCAAPGLFGKLLYSNLKQLKLTTNIIGAKTIGSLMTGHASDTPHPDLPKQTRLKAQVLAKKLL